MLDSEGVPDTDLWKWYVSQGFTPAKDEGSSSGVRYGALKKCIPELTT
jgi:hypothetical protein